MANNPNPRRIKEEAEGMFRGECLNRLFFRDFRHRIGNPNFTSNETLKAFQLAALALNKQTDEMITNGIISQELIDWYNEWDAPITLDTKFKKVSHH